MEQIILLAVLVLSIVMHEVSHGYMANWLGDPTARLAGRLSPNPVKHIDPVGSVLIPGFLYLSGAGFLFGWAKPVPYNPYNIKAPFGLSHKWAEVLVAVAGPLSNILLAVIFAGIAHLVVFTGGIAQSGATFLGYVVFMNIMLALFNLVPVPPLDGSKIIGAFLPRSLAYHYDRFAQLFQQYGILASLLFIFVFIQFFSVPFSASVMWFAALLLP